MTLYGLGGRRREMEGGEKEVLSADGD
jgi:hypothetical protein